MIYNTPNSIIDIKNLTVSYDSKPILWNINLSIPKGSLIGIIGPNGAGKSTLIKTIMGLNNYNGNIKIFKKKLKEVRKKISYVPQKESVDWDFPASVLDVAMMGRYPHLGLFKKPKKIDQELTIECLKKVEMDKHLDKQISQLSEGQKQRVFIARALAQEANLYFMDEPFSGVDASTENAVIHLLKKITKNGNTIVVVHHDLQSVEHYFNWIILLNMRIIASGPTEKVFTKKLIQETYGGKLNILNKKK
jgi:manganese/zinc/iron transport system ATP- binding protein